MISWVRGWLLNRRNRSRPQTFVQCLHRRWSGCKFGQRWCLNCGYTIQC